MLKVMVQSAEHETQLVKRGKVNRIIDKFDQAEYAVGYIHDVTKIMVWIIIVVLS